MTRDDWFPAAERALRRYYDNQRRIAELTASIQANEARLAQIGEDIARAQQVRVRSASMAVVPGGGDPAKGIDAEVVAILSAIDRLQDEASRRTMNNIEWQAAIARLRDENAPLDPVITQLDDEERRVVELRYQAGVSNYDIARQLVCSEGRVRYLHRQVVIRAARALNLRKQGE